MALKRGSDCFNKNSRLTKRPELTQSSNSNLSPLVRGNLKSELGKLLKIQNDFFPCFDWTFPPPLLSKQKPSYSSKELFSNPSVIPGRYSIYLHSPFCKSLCSFCYYSVIPGKGIDLAEKYIDYLVKEMSFHAENFKGQVCESIYFGGGTPTFLDDALLEKTFSGLNEYFDICDDAEITIEAAPGTLPKEKIILLKSLGVNRLSYGVQTLDEKLLAGMNRNYSVEQAVQEITDAVSIIGNVNIDTMYGFDDESEDALIETLEKFHKLGVPSLSIYALDKQRSDSAVLFEPPKDDAYKNKIKQFSKAEKYLMKLGYKPILQNIFIDPERSSYRHQLRRWDNLSLVALGINSQGYAPQKAYTNAASLKSYYQLIDDGKLPIVTMDKLDAELELCRELTSKLRFTYVNLGEFKYKYNVDIDKVFQDLIEALVEMGYLECDDKILRMTDKASYYNNIIPMLFAPDRFKEELLGLPEEYLETFPVPHIMTQLGQAQSKPFNLIEKNHIANIDRRTQYNRRISRDIYDDSCQRLNSKRRTSDGIWSWSSINGV